LAEQSDFISVCSKKFIAICNKYVQVIDDEMKTGINIWENHREQKN
jgi:hypothetical protein